MGFFETQKQIKIFGDGIFWGVFCVGWFFGWWVFAYVSVSHICVDQLFFVFFVFSGKSPEKRRTNEGVENDGVKKPRPIANGVLGWCCLSRVFDWFRNFADWLGALESLANLEYGGIFTRRPCGNDCMPSCGGAYLHFVFIHDFLLDLLTHVNKSFPLLRAGMPAYTAWEYRWLVHTGGLHTSPMRTGFWPHIVPFLRVSWVLLCVLGSWLYPCRFGVGFGERLQPFKHGFGYFAPKPFCAIPISANRTWFTQETFWMFIFA